MKKLFIVPILTLALCAQSVGALALELTSEAAFVMDSATGECYYEQNADEELAPASMTKVMTAYIIYEKIKEGVISKDTMITADEEDELNSLDPEATNVRLEAGKSYSVDELLGAILLPSACASCAMVGKYLCGSEKSFAELMNSTAQRLGLTAYYEDSSGLSDNNRITARSMAALARALITEYPDVLNYTSKRSTVFGGSVYKTTNHMLSGDTYEYEGCDGLKTGTTTLAGCCFTATAVRDDIRLISVTMHSLYSSDRFADSIAMLDYGFEQAELLYNSILSTDMRIFINGNEVPSFYHGGKNGGLCFVFEDLKDYGFDISWDPETRTVTASEHSGKAITPIPIDAYRENEPGTIVSEILKGNDTKAIIKYGGREYTFSRVYPIDGYIFVNADELEDIADSRIWNNAERRLDITFGEKSI